MAGDSLLRGESILGMAREIRVARPVVEVLAWITGAALAGGLVGLSVVVLHYAFNQQANANPDWWYLWQSILSAEVICLIAAVSLRYALPLFGHLQTVVRAAVMGMTLLGAALVGTLMALITRPSVVIGQPQVFLAFALMNVMLAVFLGGGLIVLDTLRRWQERAFLQRRHAEAVEQEMDLAREVQRELLPDRPPEIPGYRFAFVCQSARAVGGDTLDFVELPDGRLGIVIGDVVGKGMSAALLMANVQALVRALAPLESSPARLNAILSEVIGARAKPGRFVTFAYMILDPSNGELLYSIAGHHPPIFVGPHGTRELPHGGLPLGILAGIPYEEHRERLAPGESLILFTDGIVEAPPEPGADDEFGKERLTAVAEREWPNGALAIEREILEELDEYTGDSPAFDDTTLVVVERVAPSTPSAADEVTP